MKKRLPIVLLIMVLCAMMCSCGDSGSSDTGDKESKVEIPVLKTDDSFTKDGEYELTKFKGDILGPVATGQGAAYCYSNGTDALTTDGVPLKNGEETHIIIRWTVSQEYLDSWLNKTDKGVGE